MRRKWYAAAHEKVGKVGGELGGGDVGGGGAAGGASGGGGETNLTPQSSQSDPQSQ